jgi:hypothetical protein
VDSNGIFFGLMKNSEDPMLVGSPSMNPKIIVEVQGGIVSAVYSNMKNLVVEINDYDDRQEELDPIEVSNRQRMEKESRGFYQVY